VKVQFHWDREGKKDGDSSCWVRVSQVWAGNKWGAFFWPRIGHEVVVVFEEGDPDQPLIIGSVYNADNMPGFALPTNKMLGGFKSASFSGNAGQNYNGVVFNDQQGSEHLALHSERNLSLNSENNKMIHSGNNKGERVAVSNILTVGKLLPAGGGSGGGDDGVPWGVGDYHVGNNIAPPSPTGLLGLQAQTVFGMNEQTVLGGNYLNFVGPNVQVVLNPLDLLSGDKGTNPVREAILGANLGNMQFTVGHSSQFTIGRYLDVCIGSLKLESDARHDERTAIIFLSVALSCIQLLYCVGYELLGRLAPDDDHWRIVLTIEFQAIYQFILTLCLRHEIEMSKNRETEVFVTAKEFEKQLKRLESKLPYEEELPEEED
jgi:hypothetical protein